MFDFVQSLTSYGKIFPADLDCIKSTQFNTPHPNQRK